jgi:hypothetical protein
MDINIIYDEIVRKLKESGNFEVIANLENSAAGAATGSEALSATGWYLSNLKNTNPGIFESIKKEVGEFLEYCRENGLIIRAK